MDDIRKEEGRRPKIKCMKEIYDGMAKEGLEQLKYVRRM
jgi:hypothetical protein